MSARDLLVLKVGGQDYGGWKAVSIRTSVEQVAGTFELGITERWPKQPNEWPIAPGAFCELFIGNDKVIDGFVDVTSVNYDADSHEIKVTGRDRTGDLVDCSAPTKSYANQTFLQIAQAICKPFGITVADQTTVGRKKLRVASILPKMAIQHGESAHRTLEKLARSEAVLLISDAKGGLLITRAGANGDSTTVLEAGKNILSASLENSHTNLFSEIVVKSQIAGPNAAMYDVQHAHPVGKVAREIKTGNQGIGRYRPLTIIAETPCDAKRCQQRAAWEASSREARARRVTVKVQGWREDDGSLWRINRRVRVKCPWMRLDEMWLIAGVTYALDEAGTTAELSLVCDKAFDELPEIPQPADAALLAKFKVNDPKKAATK